MTENEALQAECDQLYQIARSHEEVTHAFVGSCPDGLLKAQTSMYLGIDAKGLEECRGRLSSYSREEMVCLLTAVQAQRASAQREGHSVRYAHWHNIAQVIHHTIALVDFLGNHESS